MANNYYDGTGVLVLERVTPVIRALFEGFALDPDYNARGDVYIALIAESNDPQWDDILEGLLDIAKERDIPVSGDGEPNMQSVLQAFANFFGVSDHNRLAQLRKVIENDRFEDEPDLEDLFLIATCFNDGHNLTAIKFEGCWRSDKARLFEFGGNSYFIGQRLIFSIDTSRPLEMATNLHQALVENDLNAATALIAAEATRLLAGIVDPVTQGTLKTLVAQQLLQPSPSAS